MNIQSLSNTNFNGLSVTKPAQETLKAIYQRELHNADKMYNAKLAVKHARKQNLKHFHDEKLFQRCFSDAWDKLDAYDTVTLDYALSNSKDLALRKKGNSIVADIFSIKDGIKTKTESSTLHNEHEVFGFFYDKFFKMLKNKKVEG